MLCPGMIVYTVILFLIVVIVFVIIIHNKAKKYWDQWKSKYNIKNILNYFNVISFAADEETRNTLSCNVTIRIYYWIWLILTECEDLTTRIKGPSWPGTKVDGTTSKIPAGMFDSSNTT